MVVTSAVGLEYRELLVGPNTLVCNSAPPSLPSASLVTRTSSGGLPSVRTAAVRLFHQRKGAYFKMVVLEGIEPPLGTNQVRTVYKAVGASSYTIGP